MPLIRAENSIDGYEISLYDYNVKEGKRRLYLKALSKSRPDKFWSIYYSDSIGYKAIANELFEALKSEGVMKILEKVDKKPSITALNINGRQFEAQLVDVTFKME
jgi:hypothetical protein